MSFGSHEHVTQAVIIDAIVEGGESSTVTLDHAVIGRLISVATDWGKCHSRGVGTALIGVLIARPEGVAIIFAELAEAVRADVPGEDGVELGGTPTVPWNYRPPSRTILNF